MKTTDRRAWALATVGCGLLVLGASGGGAIGQDRPEPEGEWRFHGGDRGMTRYSPLAQIDAKNVTQLEVAWEWTTVDAPILEAHPQLRSTNFETTPLMIGGVLFGTTPLAQAFAIDAATGTPMWSYDSESYDREERGSGLTFVNRGTVQWEDGENGRIFYVDGDARLHALDQKSGEPIDSFGEGGAVDTRAGIPRISNDRQYGASSAPMVCRDVVILGSRVADRPTKREAPPGYIRGYDAKTGKELWSFHSVPLEGEFGNETWENDSWKYSGGTNAWGLLSADEELGMVYVPFGTPTNDFWGGERLGDNLFAESLVSLDCETGKRVWHFQAVHHGLWDYDLPAPPILADITVDGREIEALAQLTKHGFTFVLDRATGDPVWPIEERPVPQSDVPGEKTSPTQPFPTRPAPFERQGITVDDLIDFTPELRQEAIELLKQYRYGPLFTPPSTQKTLLLPSYGGGANWPGGALDPETNILYIPSMTRVLVLELIEPDRSRSDFALVNRGGGAEGPRGLPLVKPPYGRITAIDLDTGEHVFVVTNGGDGPREHEAIKHLDLPPLGSATRAGALVTKTLLFVTEGSGRSGSAVGGDTGIRAFDKATGEVLWRFDLGAQATGVPMTYQVDGRQYLVVAVGSEPPRLVAFALPRKG